MILNFGPNTCQISFPGAILGSMQSLSPVDLTFTVAFIMWGDWSRLIWDTTHVLTCKVYAAKWLMPISLQPCRAHTFLADIHQPLERWPHPEGCQPAQALRGLQNLCVSISAATKSMQKWFCQHQIPGNLRKISASSPHEILLQGPANQGSPVRAAGRVWSTAPPEWQSYQRWPCKIYGDIIRWAREVCSMSLASLAS